MDLPDDQIIEQAAARLDEGELVAFPTETVYGLGADAEQAQAVARIYAAKGRPLDHPVIVHVAPGADLAYWADPVPAEAQALMRAFWPGPLTIILKRAPHIDPAVSGGQDSIGLRCPSHPVAQALLAAFAARRPNGQGGVAAPSANRFGRVSPTQAAHVRSEFPEQVGQGMPVLDGGAAEVGIESTIVDLSGVHQGRPAALLRPGHITAKALSQVLGYVPTQPDHQSPRASGTLRAHYAPRTPVEVVSPRRLGDVVSGIGVPADARWVVLAYVASPNGLVPQVQWQSMTPDPQVYARELYAMLRTLDQQGFDRIVLQHPPEQAPWQAVNDRLARVGAAFDLSTDESD